MSELQSSLKRDHAWTAIAAQSDAQQAGRRRSCVGRSPKSCLRGRLSWNAGQNHAREAKIRMVKDIKELAFYPELYMLGHREPFCEIKVIPDKIRPAQRVAAKVSELAMLGSSPPKHCPVLGSTAETKAFGLSHWIVPG